MASLGLHLLTIVLGVFFIFLGHLKVTPQFFPEYHNYIKNEFGKYNKEFPFYRQTNFRPYAKNYRLGVGITEMICGALLILGGGFLKTLSNIILLALTVVATLTFQKLHYSIEYTAPILLTTFLLVARMLMALKSKTVEVVKSAKKNVEKKVS
ncbi:unnamed protein product [Didymodactylos carnosus]|uniref:Transmembrane protein 35A n=1 Tax=Didymodactylos carnosus TaxID=1234261 RepID=A0A813PX39_9BILA|nr:unnamed protein product [Didymodactylos carnosus]CAF1384092.1 unnamed protein product [Didymodactylos carnosus]CAF3541161.1 unnamed protein product [Didymodactylos carnosus]CAF4192332.1 unnamed protein product [Didymodactylos carnosus]